MSANTSIEWCDAGAQRLHIDGSFDGLFSSTDVFVRKVGKKAAGRLLDGRTWDQFPATSS